MRKITLLTGAAIGFVLGSRMGREPYDKLEAQARKLVGRPEVQKTLDNVGAPLHTVGETNDGPTDPMTLGE